MASPGAVKVIESSIGSRVALSEAAHTRSWTEDDVWIGWQAS